MRMSIFMVGFLLIPTLLQAQNAADYWRDRQYADRVQGEKRLHELEIERIRSHTAIEVAKQNRRYNHYYRPRIVGHQVNVLTPDVSRITVITYRGVRYPRSTVHTRGVGYSKSTVNVIGTGFSYSSTKKKQVTRIGIGK